MKVLYVDMNVVVEAVVHLNQSARIESERNKAMS